MKTGKSEKSKTEIGNPKSDEQKKSEKNGGMKIRKKQRPEKAVRKMKKR